MTSSVQPAAANPASGNAFWRFSLRLYRVPGVAPACLRLQDEAGADVNVLFFLLWSASRGVRLGAAEIAAIDRHVAPWREAAVKPLRAVRRALKDANVLPDAAAADAFRNRVKSIELEAERLQQEALYGLAQTGMAPDRQARPGAAEDGAAAHIDAYQALCGTPFPTESVLTICGAFKSLIAADALAAGGGQHEG